MTVLQLDRRDTTRDTARRLRQHRPAHAVRLAAFVLGINARHPRRPVRAPPVTGFRITSSSGVLATEGDADSVLRTSAVTAFSAPRRVLPTTPITTALVNTSVMSTTVRHLDHCADSLRTGQVSARLVVGAAAPRSASRGAGFAVTGFRTTPCTCVRATARASVSVLDTTAFTTSRTLRHSVAVAAPLRRVPRRPFPFACAPGFFVPDRLRGLWFSHPTHLRCSC